MAAKKSRRDADALPEPLDIDLGEPPSDPEAFDAWLRRARARYEVPGVELAYRKERAAVARLERDTRKADAEAEKAELELEVQRRRAAEIDAASDTNLVYTFYSGVDNDTVRDAMLTVTRWMRRNPGEDITIILNSPGGSVVDGLALYDLLRQASDAGHRIVVKAYGYAASMGGILLQAGDERIVGRNTFMLIHEASAGTSGKTSTMAERIEWIRRCEERLISILAQRSHLGTEEIRDRWDRRDWWLDAEEIVELGFADRIA